jgi:CRISPR-associated endonuclease/helicase Cas3
MRSQPPTTRTVDLAQFDSVGPATWTDTVRALYGRHGPFILAYMEAVVRVADWRASGGRELAG